MLVKQAFMNFMDPQTLTWAFLDPPPQQLQGHCGFQLLIVVIHLVSVQSKKKQMKEYCNFVILLLCAHPVSVAE